MYDIITQQSIDPLPKSESRSILGPSAEMPHPPKPTNMENAPPSHGMHPVRKIFVRFRLRGRPDKRDYKKEDVGASEDKRRKEE